jgi:hypothetical protein
MKINLMKKLARLLQLSSHQTFSLSYQPAIKEITHD